MSIALRKANREDCHVLFEWRNDETTRRNSLQSDVIPWGQHQTWFASVLEDPNRELFIAQVESQSIGMIRFDLNENGCFGINILVAPSMRGMGLGISVLKAGCEIIFNSHMNVQLLALVRTDNVASQRIFEANEFNRFVCETDPLLYEYRKSAPNGSSSQHLNTEVRQK